MNRFATLFAALTGSAATAATPATVARAGAAAQVFADLEISDEDKAQLTTELTTALAEVSTSERAKGFKAANDRATAVLASDKARGNLDGALAMLANPKLSELTAEEIVASLPAAAAPAAGAGAGAAPKAGEVEPPAAGAAPAAGSAEHQARLAAAPRIALGNQASDDHSVSGADDDGKGGVGKAAAKSLWHKVQGKSDITTGGANGFGQRQL